MQLFLVRHGPASSMAASDADRELTPAGRARFEAGVRGLARLGVQLERVLSSPLVRALQTAELLEPLLAGPARRPPEVFEPLAHEPSTALLEGLRDEATALVGHEPWQSQLASWLVAGEPRGSGFGLSPGGVVALEGRPTPGGMALRGFWTPDDLVAIGGGA